MASNILNNLAKGAIGIGAGVSLFQSSIYNVDGGFRAVMFDRLRGVQVCSPTPRRLPEAPSEAAYRPHAHGCMTTLDATRSTRSQSGVKGEGTHFLIPWLQTPHIFDVRIRPRNISSATGTKDLQVVTINLRVLSQPNKEMLPQIFQQYGKG